MVKKAGFLVNLVKMIKKNKTFGRKDASKGTKQRVGRPVQRVKHIKGGKEQTWKEILKQT